MNDNCLAETGLGGGSAVVLVAALILVTGLVALLASRRARALGRSGALGVVALVTAGILVAGTMVAPSASANENCPPAGSQPTATASASPSATPSASETPSATPSETPSVEPSPSETPSVEPSPSETPSVEPSPTPTVEQCGENEEWADGSCVCVDGYVRIEGVCVPVELAECTGMNEVWDGQAQSCVCLDGYGRDPISNVCIAIDALPADCGEGDSGGGGGDGGVRAGSPATRSGDCQVVAPPEECDGSESDIGGVRAGAPAVRSGDCGDGGGHGSDVGGV
ncbi:hypothetical protein EDD28_1041 [Salana multivorans]|uniref:Uncharacterized protein n=1 Tax=Salana multivorans TaxID=120377 RepID=A0A3N2D9I4_9MICO|nr:hypothetical protein [Salana multivorans]ROR96456.1 hypothetical protein EDD28_1041 [Salana multivorans]